MIKQTFTMYFLRRVQILPVAAVGDPVGHILLHSREVATDVVECCQVFSEHLDHIGGLLRVDVDCLSEHDRQRLLAHISSLEDRWVNVDLKNFCQLVVFSACL